MAWLCGLKTTYYLRAMGASTVEKSTVSRGTHNAVSSGVAPAAPAPAPVAEAPAVSTETAAKDEFELDGEAAAVPLACSIDNPDCEACQ